jgi:hypothetical protein
MFPLQARGTDASNPSQKIRAPQGASPLSGEFPGRGFDPFGSFQARTQASQSSLSPPVRQVCIGPVSGIKCSIGMTERQGSGTGDYGMEEDIGMDRERIYRMRRTARKLAHNRSRDRVVRKLPQSVVIVRAPRPKRVIPVRKAINGNKRMTYILLLGATLCAYMWDYMWDVDPNTLDAVIRTVSQAAESGLGGILGST